MDLHFVCIDDPSSRIIVPSFGFGIDSQNKGPGKAVSYAVKYALLKTFGLETGDDPEQDDIQHKPSPQPQAPDPQPLTGDEWIALVKAVQKAATTEELTIGKDKARAAWARMTDVQRTNIQKDIADATARLTPGVAT